MKYSITQDQFMNYIATVDEETRIFTYSGKSYGENPDRERAASEAGHWVTQMLDIEQERHEAAS